MATLALTPGFDGERILHLCIGASIVVHALAMIYAPRIDPPLPPPTPFKATLRTAPALPAPVATPEPAKLEPVAATPTAPPPPPAEAKPVTAAKPVLEKAPAKSMTPAPAVAPSPAPPTPATPAAPVTTPTPAPAAEARPAAPPAETAKAASPGTGTDPSDRDLIDSYQAQLAQVAAKYKRYPNEAMQNNWEGTATVRMRIGSDGKIAAVEVVNSSGHAILDEQASVTLNKAKPFVQIPPGLRGKEFVASVRVVFSLKN